MIHFSVVTTRQRYFAHPEYFHRLLKSPTAAFQIFIVPPQLVGYKINERAWSGDHVVTIT